MSTRTGKRGTSAKRRKRRIYTFSTNVILILVLIPNFNIPKINNFSILIF
jgi:hypothetical protein